MPAGRQSDSHELSDMSPAYIHPTSSSSAPYTPGPEHGAQDWELQAQWAGGQWGTDAWMQESWLHWQMSMQHYHHHLSSSQKHWATQSQKVWAHDQSPQMKPPQYYPPEHSHMQQFRQDPKKFSGKERSWPHSAGGQKQGKGQALHKPAHKLDASPKPRPGCADDHDRIPGSSGSSEISKKVEAMAKPTAVMIRNIPVRFTQVEVVATLNMLGFQEKFDTVFLPMNVAGSANLGYVFVNFTATQYVEEVKALIDGKVVGASSSAKICEVTSANVHGRLNLARHIRRHRARSQQDPSQDASSSPISFDPQSLCE